MLSGTPQQWSTSHLQILRNLHKWRLSSSAGTYVFLLKYWSRTSQMAGNSTILRRESNTWAGRIACEKNHTQIRIIYIIPFPPPARAPGPLLPAPPPDGITLLSLYEALTFSCCVRLSVCLCVRVCLSVCLSACPSVPVGLLCLIWYACIP